MNKEQLIADIKAMSVLELFEIVKALEEEFGVAMNEELEREVLVMCNLSQGVKAEGLGRALGSGVADHQRAAGGLQHPAGASDRHAAGRIQRRTAERYRPAHGPVHQRIHRGQYVFLGLR